MPDSVGIPRAEKLSGAEGGDADPVSIQKTWERDGSHCVLTYVLQSEADEPVLVRFEDVFEAATIDALGFYRGFEPDTWTRASRTLAVEHVVTPGGVARLLLWIELGADTDASAAMTGEPEIIGIDGTDTPAVLSTGRTDGKSRSGADDPQQRGDRAPASDGIPAALVERGADLEAVAREIERLQRENADGRRDLESLSHRLEAQGRTFTEDVVSIVSQLESIEDRLDALEAEHSVRP